MYFADASGTTWCYALSGEKIWSHRGNAPILTRPTVADGAVYVTNVDDLVVAVYDGDGDANTDRLKLYKDGSEISMTYSGTIPSATDSNASNFYVGAYFTTTLNFAGEIDDLRIYTRALSSDDVASLYALG